MLASLLVLSALLADPVATDFTWPVKPYEDYYHAQEVFDFFVDDLGVERGHHYGVDINLRIPPGANVNSDMGKPVYSIAAGKVVRVYDIEDLHPWGKVLVIAYVLPDFRIVYAVYAHLERIDVGVGETVMLGQAVGTIGNANGFYTQARNGSSAHLHFEMKWRAPFPPDVTAYETKLELKRALDYCIPTLFIESRLETIKQVQPIYPEGGWQSIKPRYPAPFVTAYLARGSQFYSVKQAIDDGWLKGRWKGTDGRWYPFNNTTLAGYMGYDSKIELKTGRSGVYLHYFPLNWGEKMVPFQARQDTILAANLINWTGYKVKEIRMVDMDIGPYTYNGWRVYRADVPVKSQGGMPDEFIYYRDVSNPLRRQGTFYYGPYSLGTVYLAPLQLYWVE
ncbi:MAG: M23 family metallopeptidase [Candidatus Pacebacteria bacterium]|nr:M23 family metallopeptidase [Candidatus Paceibacterota bacterium]